MRNLIFILSVLIIAISCEKEAVLDFREGMTFDPDSLIIESSEIGWELYSWQSSKGWRFSLMAGTDRIRTTEEILSNPYNVNGREQLKLLIRRLPLGEQIIWIGPEWINQYMEGLISIYEMPPLLTQYDIHTWCRRNVIDLFFVP